MKRACFVLVLVTVAANPVAGMSVEYVLQTKYVFSDIEKQTIQAVADSTEQEVRQVLPQLRADLTLEVTEGPWVTAETGASGSAVAPRRVRVMIDATRDGGVIGTIRRELRSLLFHELHHLVRVWTDTGRSPLSHVSSTRLLDRVLSEGMATVFERDFASARPPWATYPEAVRQWTTEMLSLGPGASHDEWMFRHPDGRTWIGYRVGVYIVDLAMAATRRNAADLALVPTDELIRLAGLH